MGAPAYNTRDAVRNSLPTGETRQTASGAGMRLESLEEELRRTREELARLHELIQERESKGKALIDAYREVIADLANLFETQRNENIKRDESLRFFLNSIEGRLKADIRNELSGGAAAPDAPRGWWPFRRNR
jgi:uncharacterized protein YhaN